MFEFHTLQSLPLSMISWQASSWPCQAAKLKAGVVLNTLEVTSAPPSKSNAHTSGFPPKQAQWKGVIHPLFNAEGPTLESFNIARDISVKPFRAAK